MTKENYKVSYPCPHCYSMDVRVIKHMVELYTAQCENCGSEALGTGETSYEARQDLIELRRVTVESWAVEAMGLN